MGWICKPSYASIHYAMSLHRSIKTVVLSNPSVVTTSKDEDWDMDESRAYDIYVDHRDCSSFKGAPHEGDVYVRIGQDERDHAVHVYTSTGWKDWDPCAPLSVTMVGTVAQTTPCAAQGLRYVVKVQEVVQEVPANTPKDIATLADLIAKDVEYPPLVRIPKRVMAEVVTSPPGLKRSRRKLNKTKTNAIHSKIEMVPQAPSLPVIPHATVSLDTDICMEENGEAQCMQQPRECQEIYLLLSYEGALIHT